MNGNLLYAIGALSGWIGVVALGWAVISRASRVAAAATAAICLLIAATTPGVTKGFSVPLVWVVMPFVGWAAVICAGLFLYRALRAWLDGDAGVLKGGLIALAGALAFVWLYKLDTGNQIHILRGRIDLSNAGLGALLALLVLALAVMSALGKRFRKAATHLVLLAGCVVFGLPFLWMLLTSFKEDKDMVGPSGLIWVPRVQRTVPYRDPQNPLLETVFRGNWVQATLLGRTSDASYIVEVQRPLSLRGLSFTAPPASFKEVPADAPVVSGPGFTGFVVRELDDGRQVVQFLAPAEKKGQQQTFLPAKLEPVRNIGLRTQNYSDALEAMPPETHRGLMYLKNTLIIVILSVIGTLLSSSLVAYGFARIRFPGRDLIFKVLLATMMLPGAVTLLPQFLLFRWFGWIDTLYPLWVPAFFASAFNVFLLRQFFTQVPAELEEAGKLDGAGVLRIYWTIMLPQIKPALAVVAIWTFMGAWNNFMGPLIYVNNPENMPLSYALQLFQSERGGEPALMMAFATLTLLPVLLLFFFAQRYFIEGVTLSGLGGR